MPMTWPLTFSSPPFDWYLTNDEANGDRAAGNRGKLGVARGSYKAVLISLCLLDLRRCRRLTDLASRDEIMLLCLNNERGLCRPRG